MIAAFSGERGSAGLEYSLILSMVMLMALFTVEAYGVNAAFTFFQTADAVGGSEGSIPPPGGGGNP